ncbi:MAG: response regulator [Candidatus Omnitrophota bacterium]
MSKKILIIDDEEYDRNAMLAALKREGYHDVECSDSGCGGLEKIKSFKPDIVLVDVVLQDIDGIEVCKQIKSMEEISPKVIIITGHLDAIDARRARTSGADEIIEKTVGFSNIGKTINKLK